MNATTPLDFCLLIPCYNNVEGLVASLKTVCYTPNLFKVVVVDDGSQAAVTIEFLTAAGINLPIQVIRLSQNSGITHALNTGLNWIMDNVKAKYIARLDCGDRCHPDRFFKQVAFLDAHPAIGLLGSWCLFKGEHVSASFYHKAPLQNREIRKAMHLRNVFIHPTVMWRKELLSKVGVYPYEFPHAEDYAFFWMLLNQSQGSILDEVLVTCLLSKNGISTKNRKIQLESCRRVINKFGNEPLRKLAGNFITFVRGLLPQKVIFLLKKGR